MPRRSARWHLLGLIAAAVIPVWLFAAYLLGQYAVNERQRFDREALQVARQVSLVVEGELTNLQTLLEGLSKSTELASGNLQALHGEATRLGQGTKRVILLRDRDGRQFLNTQLPFGTQLPNAVPVPAADIARFDANQPVVSGVYASPVSGEFRVAVALPVRGPQAEKWILAVTIPTSRIHDVMAPAVPEGWTVGVGDRDGAYVSRSQLHDEMTGKPGLPEYLEKVVGRSGTFTAKNFQGTTLLAGYYRSPYSDWFYTANIPLSVVQAPLWRSLVAIGAIGVLALLVSSALAYFVGLGMARAAGDLASRAAAVGQGKPVEEMNTTVSEFAVIADALAAAERALVERTHELQAVLETVPAAVWFTYDPHAREVIRNRFAAELMGVPSANRRPFGAPDFVIDTMAFRNGNPVSREDRPLSRAMRGEHTDHEEFTYILLDGVERTLLTSARPIYDTADRIIGAVQVSLDISERKRGEEQRKLLLRELNHRVKNTLAVVQSIASQTLNSAGSLQEAGVALTSRLVSLAKAHDMLTQDNWSSTDLQELVIASVTPHAGLERFRIEGEAVRLTPKLTLSIALALHELTTNAIKYGALSGAGGHVSVAWSVAADEARHLRIEWREEGGPEVEPPSRKGFGTRMLGRILDAEPGGGVTIRFEPQGLVCILELDLGATEVAASR